MKYFGIGISRTGTSSLAEAFDLLGYKQRHYMPGNKRIEQYDFVNDMPIYWTYKELDEMYPNSKFIYTDRNVGDWKQSCINYFGGGRGMGNTTFEQYWKLFFKNPNRLDVEYERIYQEHQEEVFEYFKDRPEDLLLINIPAGQGWETLCPFTGDSIPSDPFPYKNKLLT